MYLCRICRKSSLPCWEKRRNQERHKCIETKGKVQGDGMESVMHISSVSFSVLNQMFAFRDMILHLWHVKFHINHPPLPGVDMAVYPGPDPVITSWTRAPGPPIDTSIHQQSDYTPDLTGWKVSMVLKHGHVQLHTSAEEREAVGWTWLQIWGLGDLKRWPGFMKRLAAYPCSAL